MTAAIITAAAALVTAVGGVVAIILHQKGHQ